MNINFPAVFSGSIILFCSLTYLFPSFQPVIWEEDGIVEGLGAFFFLAAAVVSLYLQLTKKYHHPGKRILQYNVLFGLFGFLDEMSFGERLFGFGVPKFYGINLDAVHDLLEIGLLPISNRLGYTITGFLFGLTVVLVLSLAILYRNKMFRGRLHLFSAFNHIMCCAGLVIAASIGDLQLISFQMIDMLEELFEMNAGIALIFSGMYVRRDFLRVLAASKKPGMVQEQKGVSI